MEVLLQTLSFNYRSIDRNLNLFHEVGEIFKLKYIFGAKTMNDELFQNIVGVVFSLLMVTNYYFFIKQIY